MLPCRMQAKQSAAYRSIANSTAETPPARPGKPFTKRELSRFLGTSERFIELEVNRERHVRLDFRIGFCASGLVMSSNGWNPA